MIQNVLKNRQKKQHMKIARQCCKTAFVTPAQICIHKIFLFTGCKNVFRQDNFLVCDLILQTSLKEPNQPRLCSSVTYEILGTENYTNRV